MNDKDTTQFEAYRPLMFSIAYRMLGSATDAEDILQEAYLRYRASSPGQIVSPKAYLSTIVTRLCLNQLESAHAQRETYIGPWLPEPILTDSDSMLSPGRQAELHDSLSIAFLALLEQLSPLERAVFLLRQVFDYEYAEIADILDKEEAACRQMFSRARKHIAEQRPRYKATPEAHRQLLTQFMQTVNTGDVQGLVQLLAEDVVMWADGGGKTRGAALHPLNGSTAVAQFVLSSLRFAPPDLEIEISDINGELAAVLRAGETPFLMLSIAEHDGRIAEIRVIGNPDKLQWLNKPSPTVNTDSQEN
jgi:RNA polymerase sigma-70 factor (ECF subfamily)